MTRFLTWAMALNFLRFGEGLRRMAWPVGRYVRMDRAGDLVDQNGAVYTPSRDDRRATDWRQA